MGGKLLLTLSFYVVALSAVHAMQPNRQPHGFGRSGWHGGGGGWHGGGGGWQRSNIPWNGYGSSSGNGGGGVGVGGSIGASSNSGNGIDGANTGGGTSDLSNGGNVGGANDPTQYCRRYASTAIDQAHEARETRSCSGVVSGSPSRWSLSYQDHYDRCLSLFGSGQNASEYRTRVAQLDQCFDR